MGQNITDDKTIRDLYKFQMQIKNADENSIDFYTSDFYVYIKENEKLSKIFNEKVKEYKNLRNDENFQNSVMKFFRQVIKEYKKIGYEIYTYEYITPLPFPTIENARLTKKNITLLYLWHVDELIKDLLPQQKELVNGYSVSLLRRNLFIYSEYPKTVTRLMPMSFIIERQAQNCYSFYFFNLEKSKECINLVQQIKIASNDIIKWFIYELKQKNKKDLDTKLIEHKNAGLTPKEYEIYCLMQEKDYTAKEIAQKLGISPSTARTHIEHIREKKGVKRKRDLQNT